MKKETVITAICFTMMAGCGEKKQSKDQLVTANEKERLAIQLKNTADKLDEDDNPVDNADKAQARPPISSCTFLINGIFYPPSEHSGGGKYFFDPRREVGFLIKWIEKQDGARTNGISLLLCFLLFYKDSNLEFQDQNLTCYHYTIEQFFLKCGAKVRFFFIPAKNRIFFCAANSIKNHARTGKKKLRGERLCILSVRDFYFLLIRLMPPALIVLLAGSES